MKKICVLIILAAIFSSCVDGSPERPSFGGPTADEIKEELRLEKAAWKRQNITDYRFTTMVREDSPPYFDTPYTVTVFGGIPTITAYDGLPLDQETRESSHWKGILQRLKIQTIDQHFKYIEDSIVYWNNDEYLPFIVKYNTQYHYPEYFAVWHSDNTQWVKLEITEFERLQ